MGELGWLLELPPMVGIAVLFITGASFATAFSYVVFLRLRYIFSLVKKLFRKWDESNDKECALKVQTEINKNDIAWIKSMIKQKKKDE